MTFLPGAPYVRQSFNINSSRKAKQSGDRHHLPEILYTYTINHESTHSNMRPALSKGERSKSRKKAVIGKVVTVLCLALLVAVGVKEAVVNHEYTPLGMTALYAILIVMGIVSGRSLHKYIKLMDSLPYDRRLISNHVTAIDVGNFRFIYHIYEKGGSFNPTNKVFISMSVPIPFPINDYEEEIAITKELADIIQELKDEGSLTDAAGPADIDADRTRQIGQMFFVEFPLKGTTSDWLTALQGKVVDIINKYNLNEYRYCTISGTDEGTLYRLYKGNLLCSTVFKNAFDGSIYRYSYNNLRLMVYTECESSYEVEEYNKLYEAAMDLKGDVTFDNLEKIIKMMFKKSGGRTVVALSRHGNGISARITIPSKASASEYHLTYESDRWWIHADGKLDNINPFSIEDETTACDIFLRIIEKYAVDSR